MAAHPMCKKRAPHHAGLRWSFGKMLFVLVLLTALLTTLAALLPTLTRLLRLLPGLLVLTALLLAALAALLVLLAALVLVALVLIHEILLGFSSDVRDNVAREPIVPRCGS
jgi:hypothetical protein